MSTGVARAPGAAVPTSVRPAVVRTWAFGTLAASLLVLVVVLLAGGGAPQAPLPGLPDSGRLTGWGLPVSRVLADLAAVATVGFVLAAAFLLPARDDSLVGLRLRGLRLVTWTAGAWAVAVAAEAVFTVSDFLGGTVAQTLDVTTLQSFLTQTSQGEALAVQAPTALAVALWARVVTTTRGAAWLLLLALAALVPPLLTGHAASAGGHDLAISSLVVHVVAASLWVGGVGALAWAATGGTGALVHAVPRFSALAAWCFAVVAVSGAANAWTRLPAWSDLVTSAYGVLVLAKVAALVLLAAFGWLHRRRVVGRLRALVGADVAVRRGAARPFLVLAAPELAVMAATVALAVGLSRTPTPGTEVIETPAEELIGGAMPAAPDALHVAFGWYADGFALTFLALAAALYATGVLVLRRRGVHWPVLRSVSWGAGLLVVAWATVGGLGRYSHVMFSAHMGAHMLLSMVAPIFLVLAGPVTLALRTLPAGRVPGESGPRQLLLAVLHSRVVLLLTHPVLAFVLFVGSLYAIYFTGLFPLLMEHHLGHAAMDAHLLGVGSLFFYVLVGVDPSPRTLHPLARLGMLFAAMPFHAFFSIAVMSSTSVLASSYYLRVQRPFSTDLLADQRLGGGIGWALGEVPILLVILAICVQWAGDDDREARRRDRAEDRLDSARAARVAADGEPEQAWSPTAHHAGRHDALVPKGRARGPGT